MSMAGARYGLSPDEMWSRLGAIDMEQDFSAMSLVDDQSPSTELLGDHLQGIQREYLNGRLTEEQYQKLLQSSMMAAHKAKSDVTSL